MFDLNKKRKTENDEMDGSRNETRAEAATAQTAGDYEASEETFAEWIEGDPAQPPPPADRQ